jgi:hypothetical protein
VFDTFPFDEWSEDIAEFWTWGPANSTGTYILTALGVLLMIASLIGFVRQESRRLDEQARRLREDGFLTRHDGQAPSTEP